MQSPAVPTMATGTLARMPPAGRHRDSGVCMCRECPAHAVGRDCTCSRPSCMCALRIPERESRVPGQGGGLMSGL
eukprot:739592-Alexandrium_andersonii.AAC.1